MRRCLDRVVLARSERRAEPKASTGSESTAAPGTRTSGNILVEDLEQAQKNPNYKQSFEEQFNAIWQAVI